MEQITDRNSLTLSFTAGAMLAWAGPALGFAPSQLADSKAHTYTRLFFLTITYPGAAVAYEPCVEARTFSDWAGLPLKRVAPCSRTSDIRAMD